MMGSSEAYNEAHESSRGFSCRVIFPLWEVRVPFFGPLAGASLSASHSAVSGRDAGQSGGSDKPLQGAVFDVFSV